MDSTMISVFAKARWSKPDGNEWQWKENVDWRFSLKNGTRIFAPQTFVLCRSEPLLLDPKTNSTLLGQNLVFPLRGQMNWSTDAASLTDRWNSTIPMVSAWLDPPDLHNNTPSIWFASIGSTKVEREYYNHTSYEFYTITAPEIVTCSIYASWRPVDMSLRPGTPFRLYSSAIDDGPEYFRSKGSFMSQGADTDVSLLSWAQDNLTEPGLRDIQLEADWANLALEPVFTVESLITNFEEKLSAYREVWRRGLSIRELSTRTTLSFLTTDALARFGSSTEVIIAAENPPQAEPTTVGFVSMQDISTLDLSNLTPIQVTRDRYGYSYSTSGTTRRLAIAVMFIHISFALTHTVLVVRYRWWYPRLQSLSDFFVLAVNSSMSEAPLHNFHQLDQPSKKHEYTIQVREVGDEKLEMEVRRKHGKDSDTSDDNEISGRLGTEP
ncbi:hypothetical protein BKA64DRAFT_728715 [Cadophora sp. MPI-SDFR-AT-0126]|nr:hypothetical protein BKA64DRAFT_728715 [Leotiomycetes sp. MPI-SDFR-AT-0126]